MATLAPGTSLSRRSDSIAPLSTIYSKLSTLFHAHQFCIQLTHRLRHDADFADDRHEIRVAAPAGDDVLVDVSGQAGACDAADVDPDVVPLRRDRPPQQLNRLDRL